MARHGQQDISGPIILAIELSGMCGSIALVSQGLCICEYSLYSTKTHSKTLINVINNTIEASGLTWDSISAVAVSLGPGSFTGLRIALATAKGLCMAFNKALIGVPTLDGLAAQLAPSPYLICPLIDARKNQVYTAMYQNTDKNGLTKLGDYQAISPESLIRQINKETLFIGDGIAVYGDIIKEGLSNLALLCPTIEYFTRASSIGMLAINNFLQNDFLDPATAKPLYVRASDAEINFGNKNK